MSATSLVRVHHRHERMLALFFVFPGLALNLMKMLTSLPAASAQYSSYSTQTVVSTDIPTGRQCFDMNQQALAKGAPDPADYYIHNGRWVCIDATTKNVVEHPTPKTTCIMSWQPSAQAPIDQTVYCLGKNFSEKSGFCNYKNAYCTNWATAIQAQLKQAQRQKEMRCYKATQVNKVWRGWVDAQAMLAMPSDPGSQITLAPETDCAKHGLGSGDWAWLTPLPDVVASSSSAAAIEVKASLLGKPDMLPGPQKDITSNGSHPSAPKPLILPVKKRKLLIPLIKKHKLLIPLIKNKKK